MRCAVPAGRVSRRHRRVRGAQRATDDSAFDQAMLQHMAARAGAAVTNVVASHALYYTQADAVADAIATAASEAGSR